MLQPIKHMSSTQPLLSVVLCTHNGEKYLAEQLNSILQQTYTRLELVVCDDASTDNTAAIIRRYATADPRIRFYQNPVTLGFNKNFEQALLLAKSDWMAIADQDDIWLPQKLQLLVDYASTDTLLVHSYNAEFRNDPTVTAFNPSRLRFAGKKTRALLLYNTVTGHTVLLHKRLLQVALPFPSTVYYDWWLGVMASVHGTVQLCPQVLVLHRQHARNASQQRTTKKAFFHQHIQMLQAFLCIDGLPENDAALLQRLVSLLQNNWRKAFSFGVFFFFLAHAKSAFYYRQKSPMLFYYLKYSFQKATMKQKYWP